MAGTPGAGLWWSRGGAHICISRQVCTCGVHACAAKPNGDRFARAKAVHDHTDKSCKPLEAHHLGLPEMLHPAPAAAGQPPHSKMPKAMAGAHGEYCPGLQPRAPKVHSQPPTHMGITTWMSTLHIPIPIQHLTHPCMHDASRLLTGARTW